MIKKYKEVAKMNKNKQEKGISLITLVVTIIVMLILAAVSIATLTGENGILSKANIAKTETKKASAKEKVQMIVMSAYDNNGKFNRDEFKEEIGKAGGTIVSEDKKTIVVELDDYEATIDVETGEILSSESIKEIELEVEINLYQEDGSKIEEGINYDKAVNYDKVVLTVNVTNEESWGRIDEITVKDAKEVEITKESNVIGIGKESYKITSEGIYTITVKASTGGVQKERIIKITVKKAVEDWTTTTIGDSEWYNYGNDKIAPPKLKGEMIPIKYIGESQTGNKWANAMTSDGSMFVWIPRYAYKITAGYHSNVAGTIEVAFITTSNSFLNGETGEITDNPSEEGAGTTKWLVHPAFTANASNGGGFGELEGLWIGKFEATGTSTNLTVKPGEISLMYMTINEQYKLAKASTFGESESMNSHMAKNSEWGATAYLGHSKYGTNRQKIAQNTNSNYYTGGSNNKKDIFKTNKTQSTTHNATGVYDMNGGSYEYVASYINNGSSKLSTYGGSKSGDLYGATAEERNNSTAYKMVYDSKNSISTDYNTTKKYKGDAMYETSNNYSSKTGSWFSTYSYFPDSSNRFIL